MLSEQKAQEIAAELVEKLCGPYAHQWNRDIVVSALLELSRSADAELAELKGELIALQEIENSRDSDLHKHLHSLGIPASKYGIPGVCDGAYTRIENAIAALKAEKERAERAMMVKAEICIQRSDQIGALTTERDSLARQVKELQGELAELDGMEKSYAAREAARPLKREGE